MTKNLKSVAREQRVHSRLGVLVAVFCVDRFALVKIDAKDLLLFKVTDDPAEATRLVIEAREEKR